MEFLAADWPTLERIDRLNHARRERELRAFAIWCVLQCQLHRSQAILLRRCIVANRLDASRRHIAMQSIWRQQAFRLAGAMLIGMKHDALAASVWIAVVSVARPDPREAAVSAAHYARLHAACRVDALDRVESQSWIPQRGIPQAIAARAWAASRAMGDQCDQLDRMIREGCRT